SDTEWPRMADFAMWAVAAEGALGLEPGKFMKSYEDNRNAASRTALESSPLVAALLAFLEQRGRFEGTARALWEVLGAGQDTRAKEWPKSPRALSGKLDRLAPNLRRAGVTIEKGRRGNDKVWLIETAPEQATE